MTSVPVSTTYSAVTTAVQYIQDRTPGLVVSALDVKFPSSHEAILSQFRSHLRSITRSSPPTPTTRPRTILAIIDGIVSRPAVILPWERLVAIAKEEGVMSLVDGAHLVGHLEVDVDRVKPDFFVSVSELCQFREHQVPH